ncbi:MAG TPA: hypothetical protein VJK03_03075 [Candidatus Nanoarchaeia archaeon]|nr:hypothetical protein [Candidatus Nanoarchaeia archaeon]
MLYISAHQKPVVFGCFAGISLLIDVKRPERSESPHGAAKFLKEILSSEFCVIF